MSGLGADRNTIRRDGVDFFYPVKAGVKIYAGALVVLDSSGLAKPGTGASGLTCVGCAMFQVDNTGGTDGAVSVKCKVGTFKWDNPATLTKTSIGGIAYVVSDHEVNATSASQSMAGVITDVDPDGGLWVATEIPEQVLTGTLAVANNLSDVADANTARHNLGADKVYVTMLIADLVGSDGKVYGIASPVTGTITNLRSCLQGHVLTTANAVLTGKIGSTAITTGVLTLIEASSALGDSVTATPSAANSVTPGSYINFTVSGTQDNASAQAVVTVEITLPST